MTKLSPLHAWCLIPCSVSTITTNIKEEENVLYPVGKVLYVLNKQTYTGSIKDALKRISLPCIDDTFLFQTDSILDKLLVAHKNPRALLNYLYEYRNDIRNKHLKSDDCVLIMEYLSEHLDKVLKDDEINTLNMIRELPLHINVNEHAISLDSGASVLVLDYYVSKQIVSDGMEEWASESGTIIVRASSRLTKLYTKLGYTTEHLKAEHVYTNHLLPKFRFLPRRTHLAHLIYIRDRLLAKTLQFSEDQKNLIIVMQNVSFIPDMEGELFPASHFKSPFADPMKTMCDPKEFPGAPFTDSCWKDFLIVAGLQTFTTSEMIMQFARKIEHLGQGRITDEVKKKSKMLVCHILQRNEIEQEGILDQISIINFILPYTVPEWKSNIFKQREMNLICFRDSVPENKADLCWTTCSLLPDYANPKSYLTEGKRESVQSRLHININPPFKLVLNHIQNVCDAMKIKCDKNLIENNQVYLIKTMMIHMYEWMNGVRNQFGDDLKKYLSQKPIVFISSSSSKLFVTCNRTVKSLDKKHEAEIKPYLMEIPDEYGLYFQLFQLLGMNTNTTICNYVRVLENLYIDASNNELHPNQLRIVRQALQQIMNFLLHICQEDRNTLDEMNALYLLTRDKTLMNAASLVFSDNKDFEEQIGTDIGLPYVLDFEEINVCTFGSVSERLKKLPPKMQPKILSDLISKELDDDCLVRKSDALGTQLSDFLVSWQFKEAIARIAVHCNKQSGNPNQLQQSDVEKMLAGLSKLNVVQVESISLRLVFKGSTVGHCEKLCYFQTKRRMDETEYILMCAFDLPLEKWIIQNYGIISNALQQCINHRFIDTYGLLLKVLTSIDNPDAIAKFLDEENVQRYSISRNQYQSVFPPAGVTMHPKWHCFLDNSFLDFEVGEYVGLLLSEERMEDNVFISAVYIYAKIIKKCETTQIPVLGRTLCYYEVNVGSGRIETKRAYDLFKFNSTASQGKSNDIVVFLDISDAKKDDRPLNDILHEVKETIIAAWTLPEDERRKIIKRLFKKWHPDKNHGNEETTTEVFKFIKQIVLRMENGENIDNNNSEDIPPFNYSHPPRNSTFWAHFQTWERDTREDTNHRRNEGTNGSSGTGRQQPDHQFPSEAAARQWLRQAKVDYIAAEGFLPRAEIEPHFNWICFMCYQCVEKVLKAMHYKKDCNNVPSSSDLNKLTIGLSTDINQMVRNMMSVVGTRERMMYPDHINISEIPADIFDRPTAERALDIAKEILEFAVDTL